MLIMRIADIDDTKRILSAYLIYVNNRFVTIFHKTISLFDFRVRTLHLTLRTLPLTKCFVRCWPFAQYLPLASAVKVHILRKCHSPEVQQAFAYLFFRPHPWKNFSVYSILYIYICIYLYIYITFYHYALLYIQMCVCLCTFRVVL